jgi:hypothetical protein
MDPEQAQSVQMHFFGGMSFEDIAEALVISHDRQAALELRMRLARNSACRDRPRYRGIGRERSKIGGHSEDAQLIVGASSFTPEKRGSSAEP